MSNTFKPGQPVITATGIFGETLGAATKKTCWFIPIDSEDAFMVNNSAIEPATESLYYEKIMQPQGWENSPLGNGKYPLFKGEIKAYIGRELHPTLDVFWHEQIDITPEFIEAQQQALTHIKNLKLIREWEKENGK